MNTRAYIADYSRDFWIAFALLVAFYLLRAAVRAGVRFARRRRDRRATREPSPTVAALNAMFKARYSDDAVAAMATRDHSFFDAVAKRAEQPPPLRYTISVPVPFDEEGVIRFRRPYAGTTPTGTVSLPDGLGVSVADPRAKERSSMRYWNEGADHDPGDEDRR